MLDTGQHIQQIMQQKGCRSLQKPSYQFYKLTLQMYKKLTTKFCDYALFHLQLKRIFMRLIVIFLVIGMHVSAFALAQRVTLNHKNASLTTVLKEIRQQTGYNFLYDADAVGHINGINLSLQDISLEEALNTILEPNLLTFEKRKGLIVIQKNKVRSPTPYTNYTARQETEVIGKVVDEEGTPLMGVSVLVKGKESTGTSTDRNGRFILVVPNFESTLIFRQIGFLTKEISLGGDRMVDVILEADQAGLEEVVVVGYGTQKKESVVASISSVTGKELRAPVGKLSNAFAGQIAGLISIQRTGEPGADAAEFWIRGISSFAGGTSPLVLVDGVPRNMNDIEADEIETFSVLKDAAATAVYGAQGANGVVLITSKRGRIQKAQISYRGEASRLNPTRRPRYANSFDYLSLY